MRKTIPYVAQLEVADCAAACLAMTLAYHGRHVPLKELRVATGAGREGARGPGIVEAAQRYGLTARGVKADVEELAYLPRGSMLHWRFDHFVVFDRVTKKGVEVVDPALGRRIVPLAEFGKSYTGVAITLEPGTDFTTGGTRSKNAFRYLRPMLRRRVLLRRVVVTSLLLQIFALALPLFTAILVNRIVPTGDRRLLVVLTAAMLVAVGYYLLTSFIRAHLLLHFRTQVDTQLTLGFVGHMADLPYSFFLERSAGDLMLRLQSNATVRETLTTGALSTLLDGAVAALYLILLFALSIPFGALVLVLGALQVTVLILARSRNQRLMRASLETAARSQSYLYQLLAGIEDLKAAGAEHRAVAQWSNLYAKEITVSLDRGRLNALIESAMATLQYGSPLILLAVGGALVVRGQLSLGTMLALAALAAGFLGPLATVVTTVLQFQLLGSYMERINDVLDTPAEQHGQAVRPAGRLGGHIVAERLSFRYTPTAPLAVDDVSAEIQPGQFVAIVGRSGSGKSTLARLLVGLYPPDSGHVTYDGVDLHELEARSVRSQLGIVTQGAYVFGASIHDNIALAGTDIGRDDVIRAARLACIDEDIDAMQMGYETMLVEGGASLSGGQRQRLVLARALAHRPSILLLDEATSALDALTEATVYRNLASLDCTLIVIAHRLSTITRADAIVVLSAGQAVEHGTHPELLAHAGQYAELVSGQVTPGPASPAHPDG